MALNDWSKMIRNVLDETLEAEFLRRREERKRRGSGRGRPVRLVRCPYCEQDFTTMGLRAHKPKCTKRKTERTDQVELNRAKENEIKRAKRDHLLRKRLISLMGLLDNAPKKIDDRKKR